MRPEITWDRIKGEGRPFLYLSYGAAITEVGHRTRSPAKNRTPTADILHDAGASLNPCAQHRARVEGGLCASAGWLTTGSLNLGRLRPSAQPHRARRPSKSRACLDRPEVFQCSPLGCAKPRGYDLPQPEAVANRL